MSENNKNLADIKDLSVSFMTDAGSIKAVEDVNFTIPRKTVVGVVGESGSGKSVSAMSMLQLLDGNGYIAGGSIMFDGKDLTRMNDDQLTLLRRHQIGFIFQSFNLIDELTVYENVELPLVYLNIKPTERNRQVKEVLEKVNMLHRANHLPQQLSGGQQQRVAIARAVVSNPKLILADEPTGNLDSKNGREVMELLSELNREGTTVIMVTHSQHDSTYAHRVLHLFDGELVKDLANKL